MDIVALFKIRPPEPSYFGHAGLRPSSVTTIGENHIKNHTTKLLNMAFGHSITYSEKDSSRKREKVKNR